jgi:hypothetical protein
LIGLVGCASVDDSQSANGGKLSGAPEGASADDPSPPADAPAPSNASSSAAALGLDAACDPDPRDPCAAGLSCQPLAETIGDGYTLYTCQPLPSPIVGKGPGEVCTFDLQCGTGLTCRPASWDGGFDTCQAPGQEGDYCDSDFDCAGPFVCNGRLLGFGVGACGYFTPSSQT